MDKQGLQKIQDVVMPMSFEVAPGPAPHERFRFVTIRRLGTGVLWHCDVLNALDEAELIHKGEPKDESSFPEPSLVVLGITNKSILFEDLNER